MSDKLFLEAFEQIGLAAGQAAALPDHREIRRESPVVTTQSEAGQVAVTIQDGKITGLVLDEHWLEGEYADTVAALIQKTINDAYEKWSVQELDSVMNVLPDVKQLYGALGAARAKLDDAWVQALAETHS